ncbi:transposase [uncultured Celeribacter sp.]|uniref:transposase n=1 Tax=uncultured Celeribacter sp. TaxID=1303376 RepID=UPI003747AA5B
MQHVLPLRLRTGVSASLLDLAGLGGAVPNFRAPLRREKTLNVTIPYHGHQGFCIYSWTTPRSRRKA